jgi:hypothetical protein
MNIAENINSKYLLILLLNWAKKYVMTMFADVGHNSTCLIHFQNVAIVLIRKVLPNESVVMKSPRSAMQLIFSKDGKVLYASDSGLGFRPGAPEPVRQAPPSSAPAPGRLPTTLPPLTQP